MKFSQSILALFLLCFLAGGCASQQSKLLEKKQQDVLDSYRLHISETIDDSKRAEQLVVIGEELYRQIRIDTKALQKMFKEFETLNKAYDTRREDLDASLHAINEHRKKMREKILDSRVKALSLTTPEEWQGLTSRRRTLIDLIQEMPGLL